MQEPSNLIICYDDDLPWLGANDLKIGIRVNISKV